MKSKEEIERLAIEHAHLKPNFDRVEEEYYNIGAINAYESFIRGYTQCQEDMALSPTKMDKKEIEKAAKHRAEFLKFRLEEDAKFYEECFIEGAEWALSQPKEDKDLLDKMYNYLKNLQTPNVSLEQKPVESEWISVEDRLPEYGSYLCCDIDNWVEVCYIRFDRTDWHSENTDRVRTPTHWMPLPNKPLKKQD